MKEWDIFFFVLSSLTCSDFDFGLRVVDDTSVVARASKWCVVCVGEAHGTIFDF